jgi:hypothetical protein
MGVGHRYWLLVTGYWLLATDYWARDPSVPGCVGDTFP